MLKHIGKTQHEMIELVEALEARILQYQENNAERLMCPSSIKEENEALRKQLKTAQELAEESIKLYNEQLEKNEKYVSALHEIKNQQKYMYNNSEQAVLDTKIVDHLFTMREIGREIIDKTLKE